MFYQDPVKNIQTYLAKKRKVNIYFSSRVFALPSGLSKGKLKVGTPATVRSLKIPELASKLESCIWYC